MCNAIKLTQTDILRYDGEEVRMDYGYQAYLAKDGVFSIEMGLFCVSDEELRFVGIRPGVGHRQDTAVVELCNQ